MQLHVFFIFNPIIHPPGTGNLCRSIILRPQMDLQVRTIKALDQVARELLWHIDDGYRHFLLTGELGAGKTALVKQLCAELKVNDSVSSPTFSLVNEYTSEELGPVYHMDFYRLEKPEDLVQIGLEEYLESGKLCLIEWPAVAESYFKPPYVEIEITVGKDNIRNFRITTHDPADA